MEELTTMAASGISSLRIEEEGLDIYEHGETACNN